MEATSVVDTSRLKRKGARSVPKGRQVDARALAEVQALLGAAPRRRDLLVEYLHRIQDAYGSISAAHIVALAQEMRLALTELCRIRAAGPDAAVDRQINDLASRLAELANDGHLPSPDQLKFVKFFTTEIFQPPPGQPSPTQGQVYLNAVNYLMAHFPNRSGVSLLSWDEGLL